MGHKMVVKMVRTMVFCSADRSACWREKMKEMKSDRMLAALLGYLWGAQRGILKAYPLEM